MEIVIHENSQEHQSPITSELERYLRNHEITKTSLLSEVHTVLASKKIDYVIVHHTSFQEARLLRTFSPETKFIAYSGAVGACWNSQRAQHNFQEVYDEMITFPGDILETIAKIELRKPKKTNPYT